MNLVLNSDVLSNIMLQQDAETLEKFITHSDNQLVKLISDDPYFWTQKIKRDLNLELMLAKNQEIDWLDFYKSLSWRLPILSSIREDEKKLEKTPIDYTTRTLRQWSLNRAKTQIGEIGPADHILKTEKINDPDGLVLLSLYYILKGQCQYGMILLKRINDPVVSNILSLRVASIYDDHKCLIALLGNPEIDPSYNNNILMKTLYAIKPMTMILSDPRVTPSLSRIMKLPELNIDEIGIRHRSQFERSGFTKNSVSIDDVIGGLSTPFYQVLLDYRIDWSQHQGTELQKIIQAVRKVLPWSLMRIDRLQNDLPIRVAMFRLFTLDNNTRQIIETSNFMKFYEMSDQSLVDELLSRKIPYQKNVGHAAASLILSINDETDKNVLKSLLRELRFAAPLFVYNSIIKIYRSKISGHMVTDLDVANNYDRDLRIQMI